MNTIFIISPKKIGNTWVFSDAERGLVNEPFVGDTNRIIDELVKGLPSPEKGVAFLFSAQDFPGRQAVFERRSPESDGWWYLWSEQGFQGWLCPAMFKYFPDAPEKIYLKVEAAS